ncbi:MAG TPA: hypothetical protein VIV55_09820 [Flavobacterium sp.]
MTYLNIKTSEGVETIDELNPKDFKTYKEFLKELKRLKGEYQNASPFYGRLYTSQRCTNEWKLS